MYRKTRHLNISKNENITANYDVDAHDVRKHASANNNNEFYYEKKAMSVDLITLPRVLQQLIQDT
jgi:hypothetical protein